MNIWGYGRWDMGCANLVKFDVKLCSAVGENKGHGNRETVALFID